MTEVFWFRQLKDPLAELKAALENLHKTDEQIEGKTQSGAASALVIPPFEELHRKWDPFKGFASIPLAPWLCSPFLTACVQLPAVFGRPAGQEAANAFTLTFDVCGEQSRERQHASCTEPYAGERGLTIGRDHQTRVCRDEIVARPTASLKEWKSIDQTQTAGRAADEQA